MFGLHIFYISLSFSPALVQIAPPRRQSLVLRRVDPRRMVSQSCSLALGSSCFPCLCIPGFSPFPDPHGWLCSRDCPSILLQFSACSVVVAGKRLVWHLWRVGSALLVSLGAPGSEGTAPKGVCACRKSWAIFSPWRLEQEIRLPALFVGCLCQFL